MKVKMKNTIIPMVFINLMLIGFALGQNPKERDEMIKREIDIYNNILNKLIIKDSPFYFTFDDRVKGVYLDGFGMLFDMESYGLSNISESVSKTLKNLEKIEIINNEQDSVIKVRTGRNDRKDAGRHVVDKQASISEQVAETKKLMTQFFVDYASAVKSLNPDERIVVNIRSRGQDSDFIYSDKKEKAPTQLRAAILVSDLNKFRQGKLTEAQLIQRLQFTDSYDVKSDHEIEIMENILNTALGKSNSKSALALTGGTRGIYLDNYGVLFFSPASIFDKGMRVIIKNISNWEQRTREYEAKSKAFEKLTQQYEQKLQEYENKLKEYERVQGSPDSKLPVPPALPAPPVAPEAPELNIDVDVDWKGEQYLKQEKAEIDSIVNALSDQIVELLGQYGHTMRKVKDNEWIMVAVDFNYRIWDSDADRLYIKVKKSDLLKYNRDEINFDTLKKSVKIWRG